MRCEVYVVSISSVMTLAQHPNRMRAMPRAAPLTVDVHLGTGFTLLAGSLSAAAEPDPLLLRTLPRVRLRAASAEADIPRAR